jgi:hypothetical protein
MPNNWNKITTRDKRPHKPVWATVEERANAVRNVQALGNKDLIAFWSDKTNNNYLVGVARREIVRRRLMTNAELETILINNI